MTAPGNGVSTHPNQPIADRMVSRPRLAKSPKFVAEKNDEVIEPVRVGLSNDRSHQKIVTAASATTPMVTMIAGRPARSCRHTTGAPPLDSATAAARASDATPSCRDSNRLTAETASTASVPRSASASGRRVAMTATEPTATAVMISRPLVDTDAAANSAIGVTATASPSSAPRPSQRISCQAATSRNADDIRMETNRPNRNAWLGVWASCAIRPIGM